MFQFTLPRGERPNSWDGVSTRSMFQFTLPRGERPELEEQDKPKECFNSRSREGSDTSLTIIVVMVRGFQFTLPRGERH